MHSFFSSMLTSSRNSKAQTSLLGAFRRHQRHWCGTPSWTCKTPNDYRAICRGGILLKRSRLTPENWWLIWLEDARALPFLGQLGPSFSNLLLVSGSVSKIPNHSRELTAEELLPQVLISTASKSSVFGSSILKEPHVQRDKAQLLCLKTPLISRK